MRLTLLYLAAGGVIGVYVRYGMTQLIHGLLGQEVPIATLTINLLGSFLLAFLFILAQTSTKFALPAPVRLGLFTGILGAFTTFSTFILEAVALIDKGKNGEAALYII